jgi:antitoxin (DNA-binding transcriptional repressor) of toxin-antitoxin stability system
MDISVTDFKAKCLDLIRKVEKNRTALTIRRRGKAVARLEPAEQTPEEQKPWEQLRALGGSVLVAPQESAFEDQEFEAQR